LKITLYNSRSKLNQIKSKLPPYLFTLLIDMISDIENEVNDVMKGDRKISGPSCSKCTMYNEEKGSDKNGSDTSRKVDS